MALIKADWMQISGKVRGLVFAKNKGGDYVRSGTVPINPQSQAQLAVRAIMTDLAQRFQTSLTQAQIEAWQQFGKTNKRRNVFGDQKERSGISAYAWVNFMRRLLVPAEGYLDDPPNNMQVRPITPFSISSAVAGTTDMEVTGFNDATATEVLIARTVLNKSLSLNNVDSLYRIADSSTNEPSPWTFSLPETLVEGGKVFCRLQRMNIENGAVSPAQEATAIVSAAP